MSNSVKSIGAGALRYCYEIKNIIFSGTKEEWNNIKKTTTWNYNTQEYTVHCNDGDLKDF